MMRLINLDILPPFMKMCLLYTIQSQRARVLGLRSPSFNQKSFFLPPNSEKCIVLQGAEWAMEVCIIAC